MSMFLTDVQVHFLCRSYILYMLNCFFTASFEYMYMYFFHSFLLFYNYNREVQHYWAEHLECSGDLDGAIDQYRSCGDYRSV